MTCHNLGQLIGYPILNLAYWQKNSHWYLRTLEEVLIQTLHKWDFETDRREGYTGVWMGDQKVSAIGVAIRRWITSHGFALNINNNMEIFQSIIPCGITEFGVTNLLNEGFEASLDDVAVQVKVIFEKLFECTLEEIDWVDEEHEKIEKNGMEG